MQNVAFTPYRFRMSRTCGVYADGPSSNVSATVFLPSGSGFLVLSGGGEDFGLAATVVVVAGVAAVRGAVAVADGSAEAGAELGSGVASVVGPVVGSVVGPV